MNKGGYDKISHGARRNALGTICFASNGGLYAYSLGVATEIERYCCESKIELLFSASSGGSISAVSLATSVLGSSGIKIDTIAEWIFAALEERERSNHSRVFPPHPIGSIKRFKAKLREQYLAGVPLDQYSHFQDRLFLYTTAVNGFGGLTSQHHSQYTSNSDVIDCMDAASYVPAISGWLPFSNYRGGRHLDGGIKNYDAILLDPPPKCIAAAICPLYIHPRRFMIDYAPVQFQENSKWTRELYNRGKTDARAYDDCIVKFFRERSAAARGDE